MGLNESWISVLFISNVVVSFFSITFVLWAIIAHFWPKIVKTVIFKDDSRPLNVLKINFNVYHWTQHAWRHGKNLYPIKSGNKSENRATLLQAGKFNGVSLKAIAIKTMRCQLFIDPPIREIRKVRNGFILLFYNRIFGFKNRFLRLCSVKYLLNGMLSQF